MATTNQLNHKIMIIDAILDRMDGCAFRANEFREYVLDEYRIFRFGIPFGEAFNEKDEKMREIRIKKCLIWYIIQNDYNIDIINFVLAVK